MRLLGLHLTNFGPFRASHFVDLRRPGLIAIGGDNRIDPGQVNNGSGKSSILDGLLWTAYGETGPRDKQAGLKTDDVVNEDEGKGCVTCLDFEADDGLTYRVERWRKAKDSEAGRTKAQGVRLLVFTPGEGAATGDGWEVVEDLDSDNVQPRVDGLLGLDYKLALKVLVRSQQDSYNFAETTPKERAGIVTEIEDLSAFDEVETNARARGREVATELAKLSGEINGLNQTLAILRDDDPGRQADDWEAQRAARVNHLVEEAARVRAEIEAQQQLAVQKDQHAQIVAECDVQLAQLVTQAEPAEVGQWRARLAQLRTAQGAAVARESINVQARNKLAATPGVCGECGQAVAQAHIDARAAHLDEERQAIGRELTEVAAQMAEAQAVIDAAVVEQEKYRRAIQQQRDEVTTRRTVATRAIYDAQQAQSRVAQLTANLDRVNTEMQQRSSEANPYLERVAQQTARIAQLEAQLEEKKGRDASLKTEAGLLEWWARAVPSIKSWVFDSVVGELTVSANRWLNHFMHGSCTVQIDSTSTTKGGRVKDEIGIRLFKWKPSGVWTERPYAKWSGGEKRRISLALDWALADRLAQRSHAKCSFIALDEVDRNLDALGIEGLLTAIADLRREKETVWIITQDADFNATPDVAWTVIKDENGSRIEEEENEREADQDDDARDVAPAR
jgi:DNA repair exonuclease SbcCD ATPase subunit